MAAIANKSIVEVIKTCSTIYTDEMNPWTMQQQMLLEVNVTIMIIETLSFERYNVKNE